MAKRIPPEVREYMAKIGSKGGRETARRGYVTGMALKPKSEVRKHAAKGNQVRWEKSAAERAAKAAAQPVRKRGRPRKVA